jgi:hypothetical protein
MVVFVLQQRLNLRDLLMNVCRGEAPWHEHRPLLSPITEPANKLSKQCGKKGLGKERMREEARKNARCKKERKTSKI